MSKRENRTTASQAAPSGNLPIADQWADFSERFRALSEEGERKKFDLSWSGKLGRELPAGHEESAPGIFTKKGFNAISQPTIWEQGGIIDVEELDAPADGFVAHFEALATRAARVIGVPEGITPLRHWIQSVRHYTFSSNACDDSAAFCSHLERQALEGKTVNANRSATRGRKPNPDFHRRVTDVVKPFGGDWRNDKNLRSIVAILDKPKTQTPPSAKWKKRTPPAQSWTRAREYYAHLVIKSIEHSLEVAAKKSPA